MVQLVTIKARKNFLLVMSQGQKTVSKGMVLFAKPTLQDDNTIYVGFVASKKVGNAVKRNRIKRRLRAAVKQVMLEQAAVSYYYVLVARSEALTRPFSELVGDLSYCLKKCRLVA